MKKRTHGLWEVAYLVAWVAFCVTALSFLNHAPFMLALVVAFAFNVPFKIATDRLYHSYWMWRHPLRCEKGGHAAPAPEES